MYLIINTISEKSLVALAGESKLRNKIVWESEYVSFHPNINTETLEITKDDFHKYVFAAFL